ncbi:XPG domain containing-domain-containing protein [Diplogelasinospora grovesii]|uniref:XPG domain containing-domain-containing protein n=1 Tax=Diplogelasinospora grovesii TaxID=303347 RepID=A0AAN6NBC3_9PEZI|nr:XPG domain containing-domain-containing protein [Diplogelasinospora grovesii]
MGIPGLKRHLDPYGLTVVYNGRNPLNGIRVVIDGPALAYHVLSLCQRNVLKSSPFEQPSYRLLGQTALSWLDEIQTCGADISCIYFDGFLPSSKRDERIKRLLQSSRSLRNYHLACPTGVPAARPNFVADQETVELFPASLGGSNLSAGGRFNGPLPPPPPFLVPAIIDYLMWSEVYEPITKVVPGEADAFCARHVKKCGGAVITSDSDLLVHDLGQSGSVIFLDGIHADSSISRELKTFEFTPSNICDRLAITPDTGLSRLAFELFMDNHLTLEQAVERLKREPAATLYPTEHAKFMEPYLFPETAGGEDIPASKLDPRISEIALRCLHRSTGSSDLPAAGVHAGLEMYLPVLLDSPTRTSAWETSKSVRQLAYAYLPHMQDPSPLPVSEFRRLQQSPSTGTPTDVPHRSLTARDAAKLTSLIRRIQSGGTSPEVAWVIFSIILDIENTYLQGKGHQPLSLQILRQEFLGELDECSWDFVHFCAQVQATLYSLRMLRKILRFTDQVKKDPETPGFSTALDGISMSLVLLPLWRDFPTISTFGNLLRRVREEGGLAFLYEVIPVENMRALLDEVQKPPEPKEKNKKNKKRKGKSPEGQELKRPAQHGLFGRGNRFDIFMVNMGELEREIREGSS